MEPNQGNEFVERSLKELADIKFALDRSAIVAITNAQGTILYVNDKFCEISQYSRAEILGQNHRLLNSGYHPKEFFQQMWATICQGQVWQGEIRNRAKDGSFYWVDTTIVPFLDEKGKPYQYIAIRSDITQRKQAEAERRSAKKDLLDLKFALDQSSIVAITDRQGTIIYVNDKFCEISQYSRLELLGQNHRLINSGYHSKEFFQQMWATISQGKVWKGEIQNRAKDGSFYWVDTTIVPFLDAQGKPYQYIAIRSDITQRKQAEIKLQQQAQKLEQMLQQLQQTQAQLVQTEKMSSLGQLVAGVAHEINNPINFIHGNLMHAEDYVKHLMDLIQVYQAEYPNPTPAILNKVEEIDLDFLGEDVAKLLNSMQVGAVRIRDIVRSLRIFSRLDEADLKAVNIHEGIDSTLMILQNRLKAKPERPAVQVVKNYGDLPLVDCYAGQINQVFMNILSNALDALDEKDRHRDFEEIIAAPSKICIETQKLDAQEIIIRIYDNGPGMSVQVKQQLFNPFFTTKPLGKGTGLGMSISYEIIIEKHRGSIECISEPGKGTEFVIKIPQRQEVK